MSVRKKLSGVYANQLAQLGFVVLAFDPAFMGDSGGEPRHVSGPDIFAEFFSYYGLKRWHHPNARGGFTTTSMMAMMNFRSLDFVDQISSRPILMVVGENAH